MWAHLFGRGIVRTLNDFGTRGDCRPIRLCSPACRGSRGESIVQVGHAAIVVGRLPTGDRRTARANHERES
ncbi:MAG: hypothetical protein R3B96_21225 [Pirellulaceae bacterium]